MGVRAAGSMIRKQRRTRCAGVGRDSGAQIMGRCARADAREPRAKNRRAVGLPLRPSICARGAGPRSARRALGPCEFCRALGLRSPSRSSKESVATRPHLTGGRARFCRTFGGFWRRRCEAGRPPRNPLGRPPTEVERRDDLLELHRERVEPLCCGAHGLNIVKIDSKPRVPLPLSHSTATAFTSRVAATSAGGALPAYSPSATQPSCGGACGGAFALKTPAPDGASIHQQPSARLW